MKSKDALLERVGHEITEHVLDADPEMGSGSPDAVLVLVDADHMGNKGSESLSQDAFSAPDIQRPLGPVRTDRSTIG